jgi:enterochelin esterase-like enzyme
MMARALVLGTSLWLCGCATAGHERMAYRQLKSPAMGGATLSWAAYTPPGWKKGEALPLIVFLHGGGGDDVSCLEEHGVTDELDRAIAEGRAPRVAIVVPQGDRGFWANWYDGSRRYEDWVVKDLLPVAAAELGTKSCPADCHVMGISMGGNGALRWAISHPELFSSAAIVSGPTFDAAGMRQLMSGFFFRVLMRGERVFGPVDDAARVGAADPFQRWRSPQDLRGVRVLITHGDADREGIADTNVALHRHLEAHGIAHRYFVFRGGHRWEDWRPLFPELVRFAAAR